MLLHLPCYSADVMSGAPASWQACEEALKTKATQQYRGAQTGHVSLWALLSSTTQPSSRLLHEKYTSISLFTFFKCMQQKNIRLAEFDRSVPTEL